MKRIFISFDYDHDRHYRYLLSALKENPRTDLLFDDVTPNEIQSANIDYVKSVLRRHITDATHTLVVVGQYANSRHPDAAQIGERNWQWWETKESVAARNRMVAVKIKREYESPTPLLGVNAAWALSFTVDAIIAAIDRA
ncbi:MAG: TIR domain-containing protein [Actinomycetota bacterium]|nr:TIR domain-containing protein [Actinomycetota bacterium]